MRTAVVAVLLLGACLLVLAEEPKAEPAKYHHKDDKTHGHDGHDGHDGYDGKDGKDGRDGRPGAQGPAGKDGKDGKDGRPGRDGRDAWVVISWKTGSTVTKTVTAEGSSSAKHVIDQFSATATCNEGEKAVACSCDTSMTPSFTPPVSVDYSRGDGGAWLGKTNFITLVKNALGPKDKDKDTCTCTALYAATVRGDGDSDGDDSDDGRRGGGRGGRKGDKDDYDVDYAKAQAAYYKDWTKKMPRSQSFSLTATVTCEKVKLVPRPHYGDEYDNDYYKSDDKKYKDDDDKKYKDDDDKKY